MSGRVRLLVVACFVLVALSGCLSDQPEAEAAIVAALTGDDGTQAPASDAKDPAPAAQTTPPATTPPTDTPALDVPAEPPATAGMPRYSFRLAPLGNEPTAAAQGLQPGTLDSMSAAQGHPHHVAVSQPAPTTATTTTGTSAPPPPPVVVPTGAGVSITRTWLVSAGAVVEYVDGCGTEFGLLDGIDCAIFEVPAGSDGREFTMRFASLVPAVAYFIDVYAPDYVGTFGVPVIDPVGTDPIPGIIAEYTAHIPPGTTDLRAYALGGADFVGQFVMGATSACPMDAGAIGTSTPGDLGSPVGGAWVASPYNTVLNDGSFWVYAEDNGRAGLQRNDDTAPTGCSTNDTNLA